MTRKRIAALAGVAAMIVPAVWATSSVAAVTATPPPSVLHVRQIDHQDVVSLPGSEPDTLVEPDVAVSPVNPDVAVAVAHDGRYASGGAVDISYAWTSDGGATWGHDPVPDLTKAVGGAFDRASDPVVQFAADGTAYLSTLLFDTTSCTGAVGVSKSTDGGATWGPPVLAHSSSSCAYSDDKNWLVIDTSAASPHRGRLYQFWTPYIRQHGVFTSPQAVRYSDDQGATWSGTFYVNPITANTQDSQPMIMADGTIVDAYLNYGTFSARGHTPDQAPGQVPMTAFDARRSTDGGRTWSAESVISANIGGGPAGVRCCLAAASIDPVTGRMYAVWEGIGPALTDPVELSASNNGVTWYSPIRVSQGDVSGVQRVNSTVVADNGQVFVSYGTRTRIHDHSGFVQQQLSYSRDEGNTFSAPMSLGPQSALQYSAVAGGHFPGDYIGAAIRGDDLYLVWCRSSKPADPTHLYHQTLWAGVVKP